jgi:hypothetical protein
MQMCTFRLRPSFSLRGGRGSDVGRGAIIVKTREIAFFILP